MSQRRRYNFLFAVPLFVFLGAPIAYCAENIADKLDAYLTASEQLKLFSGAVLVAEKDKILLSKGYGMSDYKKMTPNSPETKFRIASLTKAFTAMAVMMLEDKGLLSFDDKLTKYIADYPEGEKITIHNLLSNTSGIIDHTELPDYDTERRIFLCSLHKTIDTFKNKPLNFPPGEKFQYSNSNYILLGLIIEKCSGQTYANFLGENIFKPLGMKNSGFERHKHPYENFAKGYKFAGDKLVPAKQRVMANAHASGAIYSTVEDMFLWDRALYSDKLIGLDKLRKMFEPFKGGYALGWAVDDRLGKKAVLHAGDTDGFVTMFTRYPDDDVSIIILANLENVIIDKISEDLASVVFGKPYELPKRAATGEEIYRNYSDYTGKYQLKPSVVMTITRKDNNLFCQATGQEKLQLNPESETVFFFREVDAKVTFIRDDDRKVVKLILHQAGRDNVAMKLK
jgi:CubicO group peptidase (beta-lactamase class C family)